MATIEKRKTSKGETRYRAVVRRDGHTHRRTFTRLVDARDWATRVEVKIERGEPVAERKADGTVADVLDLYIVDHTRDGLVPWSRSKAFELEKLRADIGNYQLSGLDRQAVVDYGRDLREHMAGAGALSRLLYLAEVLSSAEDLHGITSPLAEVRAGVAALKRRGELARAEPRTRRPTADEIAKLVAYAEAQGGRGRAVVELAPIIRVLAVLPIRVGELVGIEWKDIDSKGKTVTLRGRKHPDIIVKESRIDVVPLIAFGGVDTYELIADRSRALPRPFPWARPTVSSAFWLAAKACGIEDLHLHDLRAHAISTLLEAGMPIPAVALLSGHRNWKILARHYSRLDPQAVAAMAARLT